MSDYRFQAPSGPGSDIPTGYNPLVTTRRAQSVESAFMTKVYGWMTLGLAITGVVSFVLQGRVSGGMVFGAMIAQIALVLVISFGINRISAGAATALFIVYSATMGVFLSSLFVAYDLGTISAAFFTTAGTFAAMAVIGWTTKRDLTKFGGFLFMALIGVVIASVVGIFWSAPFLTFIWLYVGLFVFLGLTVYEVWMLKRGAADFVAAGEAWERKGAILGALSLYLNFINIFIRMLAIFGRD